MASTNLFKVSNFIIQFKNAPQLELMCQSANIPGLSLGVLEIPRPVVIDHRPGDSLTYDDLRVTALCDEDLKAYKEIYSYILSAAEPERGNINVYQPLFDCSMLLTTNKNNISHKVTYLNCFFKSLGEIGMTSTSEEEDNFTFDIEIGYSFYLFE